MGSNILWLCPYKKTVDTDMCRGKAMWIYREKMVFSRPRRRPGPRPQKEQCYRYRISHCQPPEQWKSQYLLFKATQSVILCYGSSSKLTQSDTDITIILEAPAKYTQLNNNINNYNIVIYKIPIGCSTRLGNSYALFIVMVTNLYLFQTGVIVPILRMRKAELKGDRWLAMFPLLL